mmetsp:Transcript_6049/g.5406  ORF Transcript_6049/g.5406 Transcript_6049/m.5406 type:complete len:359 (+) Transcript_6049:83-1159(+)
MQFVVYLFTFLFIYQIKSLKIIKSFKSSIHTLSMSKAIKYYEATGNIDSLVLESVDKPKAIDGTIVVKNYAASINPVDFKVLKGTRWPATYPFTPGYDFAGIVDSVGPGVTNFKVADRVFGVNWGVGKHNGDDIPVTAGTFADYSLINANKVSHLPDDVSFNEAAAIALVGLTAYQSLFDQLQIQPGQRVLIVGGSGAVGQTAIQLAKSIGSYVITTASNRSIKFVESLQPNNIINYNDVTNWSDVIKQPVDAVFDTIGAKGTFEKAKQVLTPIGKFLAITGGEVGSDPLAFPPLSYAASYVLRNDPKQQDILIDLIRNKKLRVTIDLQADFTLEGVKSLFNKVASGSSIGKNILLIN